MVFYVGSPSLPSCGVAVIELNVFQRHMKLQTVECQTYVSEFVAGALASVCPQDERQLV